MWSFLMCIIHFFIVNASSLSIPLPSSMFRFRERIFLACLIYVIIMLVIMNKSLSLARNFSPFNRSDSSQYNKHIIQLEFYMCMLFIWNKNYNNMVSMSNPTNQL
jgi:hypothetical protein